MTKRLFESLPSQSLVFNTFNLFIEIYLGLIIIHLPFVTFVRSKSKILLYELLPLLNFHHWSRRYHF